MMARAAAFPGIWHGAGGAILEHTFELVGCERLADDSGGGDEHVMRLAAGRPGRDIGGLRHGGGALDPRKGIGIAGIHHERPGPAAPEIGTAPFHRPPRGISSG